MKLFKDHIHSIVNSRDEEAMPGNAPYLREYQTAVNIGIAQLSDEDRDALKEIAEKWNREGPPREEKNRRVGVNSLPML